jgi:hypothetical protein
VIVDVCKAHGTWFDPGELQHVVEFIRSGGINEARHRELERLAEQERRHRAATAPPLTANVPLGDPTWNYSPSSSNLPEVVNLLAVAAYALLRFIRW